MTEAFAELTRGVHAALETYSNVHRGSGHNSMVSTYLYEQAREIVLETLGLNRDGHVVLFCTQRRVDLLCPRLPPGSVQVVSSQEIGLPLGVRALAVDRRVLPAAAPFLAGGGTVRLVFPHRVIWASAPDRLEAGTPAVVNVIALAKALRLARQFGPDALRPEPGDERTAAAILYHDDLEAYSGCELLQRLKQTLIGRGLGVPTAAGTRPFVNLDNAASTPTFTPIWNAVWQTWLQPGEVRQEIVREVKAICAAALGAPLGAYDLIFCSNTTGAINLAAESLHREAESGLQPVVLNTLLEHNSNELPWRMGRGSSLLRLAVDDDGFLDLRQLERLLRAYNQKGRHGKKRIKLVAVSGASNVLGVFNDLAEIGRIVHRYGARLLVDAAQLVAHRPVEVERWGIDYLAFSAHKAYAPFGTGVLLARKGLLQFGPAEMERIQASGEENAGGIAALGKSLLLLKRIGLDLIREEEQALTARVLRGLAEIPGLQVFGVQDPDSPHFARKGGVIVLDLADMQPAWVARELAERGGIGVRSGCHCAHLLVKRLLGVSSMLAQLQGLVLLLFPRASLPGLVRVSLGLENSAEDVDTLLRVLDDIARHPRDGAGRHAHSAPDGTPALPRAELERQMDEFARAAARRVYDQSG